MAIANLNIAISSNHTNDLAFLEFLRAAQSGNIAGLESFLENRSGDINNTDDLYGAAATHFAARHSQVEALRFLIERGATLGNPTNAGFNELHYGFNSLEISRLIIQERPNLIDSRTENGSALTIATYCKNFDVTNFLIEENADVKITDRNGNSALHYLADGDSNNVELAISLLQRGADINAVNQSGQSVLSTAIGSGNLNISKFLLRQSGIIIDDKARENLDLQLLASEGFEKIAALVNQRNIPNSSTSSSRETITKLSDEIINAAVRSSDSDSDTEQTRERKRVSPEIDTSR
ncbi:MAG: ankyrin repeat domain-containing protein [Pseudomonadota bacterium]